jgi:hypothetical protein
VRRNARWNRDKQVKSEDRLNWDCYPEHLRPSQPPEANEELDTLDAMILHDIDSAMKSKKEGGDEKKNVPSR